MLMVTRRTHAVFCRRVACATSKGPGSVVRFWGHSCAHYTVPNDTDHTRVSIDFRVIRDKKRLYKETYDMSHRRDGLMRFADGAYFESMRVFRSV